MDRFLLDSRSGRFARRACRTAVLLLAPAAMVVGCAHGTGGDMDAGTGTGDSGSCGLPDGPPWRPTDGRTRAAEARTRSDARAVDGAPRGPDARIPDMAPRPDARRVDMPPPPPPPADSGVHCGTPSSCAYAACAGLSCGSGCLCSGGRAVETNCADGIDNNGDGLIDCADPTCLGSACNDHNACTSGEICQSGGTCGGGAVTQCNSPPSACQVSPGTCNTSTGACSYSVAPAGTICLPPSGPCDTGAKCNGSSTLCPTDSYMPAGTPCHTASSVCDSNAYCTGSSPS